MNPRRLSGRLATLTILAALAVPAHAGPVEASEPAAAHGVGSSAQLAGIDWIVEAHGPADAPQEVPDGIEITARFDAEQKTVTGRGGCNAYFGGFEVDGDKLSISNMGITQMMCGPEVMEHEDAFLLLFSLAERYEVAEDTLTVFASENRVLVFRRNDS